MKKKAIETIIKDRFKTIRKLLPKITTDFKEDDIHKFRVEVKKLKGFLKLSNTDHRLEKPLVPYLLNSFYHQVGHIRNIQLQQKHLHEHVPDYGNLQSYSNVIEDEKIDYQNQVKKLMDGKSFENDEHKIRKQLSEKIDQAVKKKFARKKVHALKEKLKDIRGDDEIHSTRKILKDILYNLDHVDGQKILPCSVSGKKELKSLTARLGDFEDQCIRIDLFSPVYVDRIKDEQEHKSVKEVRQRCLAEREILREEISVLLNKLEGQL